MDILTRAETMRCRLPNVLVRLSHQQQQSSHTLSPPLSLLSGPAAESGGDGHVATGTTTKAGNENIRRDGKIGFLAARESSVRNMHTQQTCALLTLRYVTLSSSCD